MPESSPPEAHPDANAELRLGWKILAVCLLGMCLSVNALPFYTFGVFAKPVATGLGWARADYQFAVTIFAACLLTTAPFIGALADRFGPRRVAMASFACMALGFVLASRATSEPWTFYLAWLVIAGAGASKIVWTRMINSWFARQRGLALGIALAGTGITAALAPPLVGELIAERGWRTAYVALAAVVLALGIPVVALWFHEPRAGEGPETSSPRNPGAAPGSVATDDSRDRTLREAIATRTFWVLISAFALISVAVGGLVTNLVPILVDAGHQAATAGRIAGFIGATVVVARVGCGWLLDRTWGPGVASIAFLAPAAASVLLLTAATSVWAAVLAALLIGVAGGAEFDIAAYLASRYFGRRHYGRIYGCVFAAIQAGVGTAGLVFGLGAGGGYAAPLYTTLVAAVGAAILIGFAGRYQVRLTAVGVGVAAMIRDKGAQLRDRTVMKS